MRFFRIAVLSLLLVTTPTLLAGFHQVTLHARLDKKFKNEETYHLISYDKILKILDEVESGKAKKKYKKRELARIDRFLAYLAQNGTSNQNVATLNHDINDLLHLESPDQSIATCLILPPPIGVYSSDWGKPLLLQINYKKTKEFVKKHKTAIIIGAAILVATGIVLIAATSGGAVAGVASTVGGVAGGFATNELKNPEVVKEAPQIQEYISENIHANVYEETGDLSIGEKARELGSKFAHEAFDGISDIVSFVPSAAQEIKDVGSKMVPQGFIPPASRELTADPQEKYENFVARGHGMIDNIFSTNQADQYTPDGKANGPMKDYAIGEIPPPGKVFGKRAAPKIQNAMQRGRQRALLNKITFSEKELTELEKKISCWVGEESRLITNKAGDPVFLSKDGMRKVRFDFKRTHPHDNPHLHFESLINDEWDEICRIYPSDVPQK